MFDISDLVSRVLARNLNNPSEDYQDLMTGYPDSIFKETSTNIDYGLRLPYTFH